MSWQQFKDNVLRQVTPGVTDIDTVANIYATEYDNAIKRGYDTINKQTVKESTGIESMKSMFKMALQKGQNSTEPYDLIGNMGDGVKAYWAGVVMNIGPAIPLTLPIGATANISATLVSVTNFGQWTGAVDSGGDFKLSAEAIEQSKQQLKYYKEKLKTATEEEKGPTEDKIRLEEGKLEAGEDFSIPLTGVTKGDETINEGPVGKFDGGSEWPPQRGGITEGGAGGAGGPWTPPTFPPNAALGEKIVIAARADVGTLEVGGEDRGPRVEQILAHVGLGPGNAWCASAVSNWWDSAGATRPDWKLNNHNPAWCPSWNAWAKKNGQWSDKPAIGAAVLYHWANGKQPDGDHIGIVSSIAADGSITTIEGNTWVSGKGQGCFEKKAQMNRVIGYVWPKEKGIPYVKPGATNTKPTIGSVDQYTFNGVKK
jgi:hypothetical protein